MELREIVNGATENGVPAPPADASPRRISPPAPKSSVQSACLYIGPAGQRCDRPAGESGFCSKHHIAQPGEEVSNRVRAKRAAVVIGLLAALWPVIADLIREFIRLFR